MTALTVPVSDADHSQGPADAPITLVEYADYQCPYCGQAAGTVQLLQHHFKDQVRFVFRNFPLPEMHPHAVSAALVAEFAADHGKFWQVHDALFAHQQTLGEAEYEQIITSVGLDPAEMRKAVQGPDLLKRVQADRDGGIASGVQGTPAFFINGELFPGGYPQLGEAIASALAAK